MRLVTLPLIALSGFHCTITNISVDIFKSNNIFNVNGLLTGSLLLGKLSRVRIFRKRHHRSVATVIDSVGSGGTAGRMGESDQLVALLVAGKRDATTQHDVFADLYFRQTLNQIRLS
jgi:hypothetical protein